mgnify:CR=1 FL=1
MSGNIAVILKGSILNDTTDNSGYAKGFSSAENAWQLIGMVILLVVILVAAYYTSRFVGGYKLGQMRTSNFKVIDTYRIGQNKALQIVKAGNKYILISVGKDTVNFITELEESEIHTKDDSAKEKQSFGKILEKLKNNNK